MQRFINLPASPPKTPDLPEHLRPLSNADFTYGAIKVLFKCLTDSPRRFFQRMADVVDTIRPYGRFTNMHPTSPTIKSYDCLSWLYDPKLWSTFKLWDKILRLSPKFGLAGTRGVQMSAAERLQKLKNLKKFCREMWNESPTKRLSPKKRIESFVSQFAKPLLEILVFFDGYMETHPAAPAPAPRVTPADRSLSFRAELDFSLLDSDLFSESDFLLEANEEELIGCHVKVGWEEYSTLGPMGTVSGPGEDAGTMNVTDVLCGCGDIRDDLTMPIEDVKRNIISMPEIAKALYDNRAILEFKSDDLETRSMVTGEVPPDKYGYIQKGCLARAMVHQTLRVIFPEFDGDREDYFDVPLLKLVRFCRIVDQPPDDDDDNDDDDDDDEDSRGKKRKNSRPTSATKRPVRTPPDDNSRGKKSRPTSATVRTNDQPPDDNDDDDAPTSATKRTPPGDEGRSGKIEPTSLISKKVKVFNDAGEEMGDGIVSAVTGDVADVRLSDNTVVQMALEDVRRGGNAPEGASPLP